VKAPRVLLVEDDASIRRFVEMALEELPIELLLAPSLAEAQRELTVAPVALVISDMMLPDGSGADLLQALGQASGPRPRLVAFSAGVTTARRAALQAMGVDEVLAKPVSLQALQDCVRQVLQPEPPALGEPVNPAEVLAAVETYFGGQLALFQAYSAGCAEQFPLDVQAGDQALSTGDWPALRRLVHSLKTVLLTLGDPAGSALAADAERLAAQAQAEPTAQAWRALRPHLSAAVAQQRAQTVHLPPATPAG
jgi:CheY-like chemotaxis protein